MTPKQTAILGVSRLGVPVPAGKLAIIQAIARALVNPDTASIYEEALVEWLASRMTESECLEALAPVLIAPTRPAFVNRIRQTIPRPSIASDLMLAVATGTPPVVLQASARHSGITSELDLWRDEDVLSSGKIVPQIFTSTLKRLERTSGYPFVRQWAFEFSIMRERNGATSDENYSYFFQDAHGEVGQFVARQGHWARSAYLRVLAFALDHWDLPRTMADSLARLALPAEPIFLKLAPGKPPSWATELHQQTPGESTGPDTLVRASVELAQCGGEFRLMHLSATVHDAPLLHIDMTLFGVLSAGNVVNPEALFGFHESLLGKMTPKRDGHRAFLSPDLGRGSAEALGVTPTVLPLVGNEVGYLQFDYLVRSPFIPLSSESLPELEVIPGVGGGALTSKGTQIGDLLSWYWNWRPSRPEHWPSHTGCCTRLTNAAFNRLVADYGGGFHHIWKLTLWTRERDYDDWSANEQFGTVASA